MNGFTLLKLLKRTIAILLLGSFLLGIGWSCLYWPDDTAPQEHELVSAIQPTGYEFFSLEKAPEAPRSDIRSLKYSYWGILSAVFVLNKTVFLSPHPVPEVVYCSQPAVVLLFPFHTFG